MRRDDAAGSLEPPFVRFALAFHLVRRMAPPIAMVAAYTFVAAWIVRWDMARHGEEARSMGDELYGMYTQLFFEPTEALPRSPIARAIFWVTPIVGIFLIAEGLVKIGSSLLSVEARRALWVRIMSEKMIDHVVVCGLGHVGFRVVQSLRKLGEPLLVIEKNADSFVESVRAMNVPVIVGDARRDELLVEAGIERAKAVVCATDDDLANLEVALDAKRMNPNIRVVMRMFDQRLANKVGGALDLDETFSTSSLAAPLVALQATHPGIRGVYQLEGEARVRVAAELLLGPRTRQRTVAELEDEWDVRVLSIRKKEAARFARARGNDAIAAGDRVLLDAAAEDVERLRDALA